MEDDAIEEALVYVAVEVNERHAFEEGVDAEANEKTRDGMDGFVVAVSLMGMVCMVVLMGIVFLFAAGTVVVAVFNATCQLLEKQLDEETHHDRCSNLEVDAGSDETVGFVAQKDVRNEVDEAGSEKESSSKDGDIRGEFLADVFSAWYQSGP